MKNPDGQIPNLDAALDAYVAGTESLRRLRTTSAAKTVACSAAATAALALAPSAEAAVQYGVTNDFVALGIGTNIQRSFDLNGDGQQDFALFLNRAPLSTNFVLRGTQLGGALARDVTATNIARLIPGSSVGPAANFGTASAGILRSWAQNGTNPPVTHGVWPGGSMNEANAGFLGIRFNHSGGTHYGWIRIGISNNIDNAPVAYTVYDWAWEDEAETPIAIPEPGPGAGLALLAAGAAGVSAWRRRKQPPAKSV